jgi:hypothetical protein
MESVGDSEALWLCPLEGNRQNWSSEPAAEGSKCSESSILKRTRFLSAVGGGGQLSHQARGPQAPGGEEEQQGTAWRRLVV